MDNLYLWANGDEHNLCTRAWNFDSVTFYFGPMTLTLAFCVSGGDRSTCCGALAGFVSFLVAPAFEYCTTSICIEELLYCL